MNKRMVLALAALAGVLLSLYLTLYKLGYIGTLACGTGSCEEVQFSKWGTVLGLPVAAWGTGFYALVLVLALARLQERFDDSRGLGLLLVAVTGWGVLFSAWLTYVELFMLHAICRWCVGSASITVLLFGLALWDWRESNRPVSEGEV